MSDSEIVLVLATCDPVYEGSAYDLKNRLRGVRICAICRARSGYNEESVIHEHSCPWIPARERAKELREAKK